MKNQTKTKQINRLYENVARTNGESVSIWRFINISYFEWEMAFNAFLFKFFFNIFGQNVKPKIWKTVKSKKYENFKNKETTILNFWRQTHAKHFDYKLNNDFWCIESIFWKKYEILGISIIRRTHFYGLDAK